MVARLDTAIGAVYFARSLVLVRTRTMVPYTLHEYTEYLKNGMSRPFPASHVALTGGCFLVLAELFTANAWPG